MVVDGWPPPTGWLLRGVGDIALGGGGRGCRMPGATMYARSLACRRECNDSLMTTNESVHGMGNSTFGHPETDGNQTSF